MQRILCVLALVAGCAGGSESDSLGVASQEASPVPQAACVTVGGGELQAGLTLGLGGGDVRVTAVQDVGGARVGFNVSSALAFHYVVTSGANSQCSTDAVYAGGKGIDRVTFCTGGNGCQ